MYIQRALDLLVQGAVGKPSKHLQSRGSVRKRGRRFYQRKRRVGHQGRPVKAPLVREMLYEWFSGLKHSVTTRIPHRMVLQKGPVLFRAKHDCLFAGGAAGGDTSDQLRLAPQLTVRVRGEPPRTKPELEAFSLSAQGAIGDHLVPLSEGAEVDHSLEGSRPGVGELRPIPVPYEPERAPGVHHP